jgi:hypothetical protein
MVMLYEGGLKKLTTTRYPAYPVMSYSVSRTGYVVGYVVTGAHQTTYSFKKISYHPSKWQFCDELSFTKDNFFSSLIKTTIYGEEPLMFHLLYN